MVAKAVDFAECRSNRKVSIWRLVKALDRQCIIGDRYSAVYHRIIYVHAFLKSDKNK